MRRLLAAFLLSLIASTAHAAGTPAWWEGTRTSGDGVAFYNSGNGVSLQDSANMPAPLNFGSSLYPTAVPSISTTCSITNTSATATCPTGLAINVGDTVFSSPSADIPTDGGIWPTVVSYNSGTGSTVFTTAATTTNAAEAIRFGSGQRFDTNSTIMSNSVFAKSLKLGDAAQARTWWADNNPGYTSNLTNLGPSLAVGSNGDIISGLFATHAIGAGSSHQIALDILARADATALVGGNRNSVWGIYEQIDTVNSAASFSNSAGNELEIANRWGTVDLDPYSGATNNTTVNTGFGCGAGESTNVAWGTISPCTAALEVFANGAAFRQGIFFTSTALDTSAGRIAPAISLAKNQALNFYGATGSPQWSIYANSNATTNDSIILGNGNTMTIQGDTTTATTVIVQSQGSFQSRLQVDDVGTGQNTETDFLENGTLKWRVGKRGSDSAFNLIDTANGSANAILITNAGASTFGESAATSRLQGSTAIVSTGSGGTVQFQTSSTVRQLQINDTASAVDYATITGGVTGSPGLVALGASGTDTDISINLVPKGAGVVSMTKITLTAAAPTVAAAQVGLGSTTAAASNCNGGGGTPTACLVVNVAGTTRYVPYF